MSVLKGKKILLGVTGGIAAYKTAHLVRLFIKLEAEVRVILTPSAKDFITPLTLSTLSKNEVYSSFYNEDDENAVWNNHVELGLWADLMLIAPATANTMSKMKNGRADNLLIATYLSAKCPVYFAPAMDLDMYTHASTKESLATLQSIGNILIPATSGELASGLVGEGRMSEPEEIVGFIEKDIQNKLPLKGCTFLITAGPTYEAIDPVRFIGNHSSGKMGFALAKAASRRGAKVFLVTGPTHENYSHSLITRIDVVSAQEMYEAVHKHFASVDVGIFSAAVADYKPKFPADKKIKKQETALHIELEPTQDILASTGQKKMNQFLLGFALETNNEIENAKKKIQTKNLDAIVLNSLNDKGAGFATNTNKITIIDKEFKSEVYNLKSKDEVATDIVQYIQQKIQS